MQAVKRFLLNDIVDSFGCHSGRTLLIVTSTLTLYDWLRLYYTSPLLCYHIYASFNEAGEVGAGEDVLG